MQTVKTIAELRKLLQQAKKSAAAEGTNDQVGLVPTMGYLHQGHASLMQTARKECGITVLSIFVNPLQFGPNEDFERYPRDELRDLALAEENGIDMVFMPEVSDMYPRPVLTKVSVSDVTEGLCGASRPGHFDGVATVVSKLFHIVQPDRAYFGMKDAQQVAVIERMVEDLNIPVTIVPCPIVREQDGLALSSRNVYLSAEERKQALVLSQSLNLAGELLSQGKESLTEIKDRVIKHILTSPLADIDYAEFVTYPDLVPVDELHAKERNDTKLLLALAVRFGKTRLIDNRLFH